MCFWCHIGSVSNTRKDKGCGLWHSSRLKWTVFFLSIQRKWKFILTSLEVFLQAFVWYLLHLMITVPGANVRGPLNPSMCPCTVTVDHKDWEGHPGPPCSSIMPFPTCLKLQTTWDFPGAPLSFCSGWRWMGLPFSWEVWEVSSFVFKTSCYVRF